MAKLKYNASLVQNTLDELGAASNQLINTEDEMRSALTIIANAQGIHHVHTDTLFNTLGFPIACQEMIEDTVTQLKNRASEIEAYNEEYENASFLEKLGSTAGLFLTKICEGFASAGEQIVDGFASIIGLGAGLISKDAQNSIGNFIKKDHVGDFFDNLYDTSLKSMVIKSWASEKGLACNIFKGVGTGLGYAAALAATGALAGGLSTGTAIGAKTAALQLISSLPASATLAGVAGIGAGTQAGLKGGWDYSDAFCYGLKYGAIQAGTTVVFSLAFRALSKGWNLLKNKFKGTNNSTNLTTTPNPGTNGGGTGTTGATGTTGTAGTTGTPAAKAGMFKEGYVAQNGKTYTCLDDVWDDVMQKNLSKRQLQDIIKNTVGFDDSGVGHAFLADALNVMKGKAPSTLSWRTMATSMDDTIAATTGATGTNGMSTVAEETFTSSTGSSGTQVAQETMESTAGAGLDETLGAGLDETANEITSRQFGNIKGNMEKVAGKLHTAQQALDDAIAQGADEATLTPLRQTVDDLTASLKTYQQRYIDATASGKFDAIGTEGRYKLIVGDEVVSGPNSVAGDVTTMRVGTTTSNGTVEYRPNFTNATAKAEGQINAKEFAKLLDEQYGPVVPEPAKQITALATIGPTGLVPYEKPLTPAVIPDTPTALVPVSDPLPPAVIPPTQPLYGVPPVDPKIVPASGDTIIFGVVQPEEIVPTPAIVITPAPVIPVTTAPPIIFTTPPPVVMTTPPPVVVTTPPPVVMTTPPPVVVTTPPPVVITTPPPVAVTTTPPVVTTTPPIDQEYVPIPNTGIGSPSSPRFGSAPLIAGAVAGVAGVVGGSLLSKRNQKYYDEDEERERKHKKEESEE